MTDLVRLWVQTARTLVGSNGSGSPLGRPDIDTTLRPRAFILTAFPD